MSLSKKALNTLLAGAVIATVAGFATTNTSTAGDGAKEKCYGVVKAGKNTCASSDGSHSCMSQSTVDGSGHEFIALPKGVCDKLVGGSTEPSDK